jgi:hypothetical protein
MKNEIKVTHHTYKPSYFAKMKEYIDDDIISYILTRLDSEYNDVVENIRSRIDCIWLSDLFAQLFIVEAMNENQNQSTMSANAAV